MNWPALSPRPLVLPRPTAAPPPLRLAARLRRRVKLALLQLEDNLGAWLNRTAGARLLAERSVPATSFALYAHYNPLGRVSSMVLSQLEILRCQGFSIHFVSMSPLVEATDLQRLKECTDRIITRPSFGRDFGAWRAVWLNHRARMAQAHEVLLVNDSLLGPLYPLDPIFKVIRSGEPGVYGLTDSPDVLPHLQSYFLYFRGSRALGALDYFLSSLKLSAHKRTMVERGELGLARFLGSLGVPMFTLYSYTDLEQALLADPLALETLLWAYPLIPLDQFPPPAGDSEGWPRLRRRLEQVLTVTSLNPTHYFYRILLEQFGYPFIKTELLLSNPAALGTLRTWASLVPPDAPVTLNQIQQHLTMMAQQPLPGIKW